jgi:hypothetical protein
MRMFNFEFDIRQFYVTIMVGIAGGVGFLIRKIFTSEGQIELLKQELRNIQTGREGHDTRVDGQLQEIRHDIKNLLSRR